MIAVKPPNEIELSGGPEAAARNTPGILSHEDLTSRDGRPVRCSEGLGDRKSNGSCHHYDADRPLLAWRLASESTATLGLHSQCSTVLYVRTLFCSPM